MPEYENPEAGWELETDSQEPIQIDAGYDDDCCNEILQLYLSNLSRFGKPTKYKWQELVDILTGMDCKTLLDTIGGVSVDSHNPNHSWQQLRQEQENPEKTLRDAYQECVANKMPKGPPQSHFWDRKNENWAGEDFVAGDPMDLAWRLLKNG